MQTGDKEALLDGVPDGATFKMAREEIIPPRTWVNTGMDGIEIYLDAEQNTRLLIRQWNPVVPDHSPESQQPGSDRHRPASGSQPPPQFSSPQLP